MTSNVWAWNLHLDCLFEHELFVDMTMRLNIDNTHNINTGFVTREEWRDGACVSKPCTKEGSFQRSDNFYTFIFNSPTEVLTVNRKDLAYKHEFPNLPSTSYGTCKVVERETKKNKI